jgi:hypothetical protein
VQGIFDSLRGALRTRIHNRLFAWRRQVDDDWLAFRSIRESGIVLHASIFSSLSSPLLNLIMLSRKIWAEVRNDHRVHLDHPLSFTLLLDPKYAAFSGSPWRLLTDQRDLGAQTQAPQIRFQQRFTSVTLNPKYPSYKDRPFAGKHASMFMISTTPLFPTTSPISCIQWQPSSREASVVYIPRLAKIDDAGRRVIQRLRIMLLFHWTSMLV